MAKTGRSDPQRTNADQQGAKGRLMSDSSGPPILSPRTSKVPAQDSDFLTTAQGSASSQTDDSLKAGERGPTLMEDFHLREKIMHFDHERIPERVVHARGAGAHGVFESYGTAADITCRRLPAAGASDAGVHSVLDGGRFTRFGRHRSRCPRLRGEVLHRRGRLRSRRQQHPGVLHPRRDQVPRSDPRRQARARPRDPAGADGAHDVLGLRVDASRVAAHVDVGDVRSRHPSLVPDDGGLRRPHLPARQRRRRARTW